MSGLRKSASLLIVAGLLAGFAAPVAAQYQPYPGQPGQPYPNQPYPQQPGRGTYAHACFPAEQGGYLRIEWTQSGRWAIYNWPAGSNLRIFIGQEPAQWCWSPRFGELTRPCRPNYETTKPVQPGC